ncbi:MAG: hypothetical protein IJQ32_03360 [Paludibacteraceae bacterium]|nr:hypothetical protein [Paludibacteraceae bacterium]
MLSSPFAQIMLDMQDRIAAQVPGIRMIDRYIGQDQTALKPALDYPAVLIDVENCDYEEAGQGSQFARATFSVKIFHADFSRCIQKSPSKVRENALKDFELEHAVMSALHGWAPTAEVENELHQYAEPLIRTGDRSENRNDIGLRIRTILFTTAWEERMPEGDIAHPDPEFCPFFI